MLTVTYGEATLDRSNVYRWYKMFSEGREDVNDEERAGRPSTSTTRFCLQFSSLAVGHRSMVARIARLAGAKYWRRKISRLVKDRRRVSKYIDRHCVKFQSHRTAAEDAIEIVLKRVRNAIESHGSVKVNIAFYERHVIEPTLTSLEEFQERDRGWALSRVLYLTIKVNKLNPTSEGCVLNLAGIKFPMTLKDISRFERLDDVYSIENKILPLQLTSNKQDSRDDSLSHFAWIKNRSRLVRPQLTRMEYKKFFCDRCLHYFSTSEKLRDHCYPTGRHRNPAHSNCNLNYKNSL
ncbi:GVQW3 protein, partial [Acromyrmex heyeri]